MIWSVDFWKGLGERAFHTFWQTFSAVIAVIIGDALIPAVGLPGVDWLDALSVSIVATILSVAKSLGTPEFTAGYGARRAKLPDHGTDTTP